MTLHDGAVSVLAGKGAPSDRDGRIEDFLPLVNAAAAEGSVFNVFNTWPLYSAPPPPGPSVRDTRGGV